MNKLSSTDVKNILAEVPPLLRAMNEKCAALEEELTHYKKKERVEKIAQQMEGKNIRSDLSFNEKVENLMTLPDNKLDTTEEAVQMQPSQIGFGMLDKKANYNTDAVSAFYEGLSD